MSVHYQLKYDYNAHLIRTTNCSYSQGKVYIVRVLYHRLILESLQFECVIADESEFNVCQMYIFVATDMIRATGTSAKPARCHSDSHHLCGTQPI